jgi:hypothetical protein
VLRHKVGIRVHHLGRRLAQDHEAEKYRLLGAAIGLKRGKVHLAM